MSEGRGLGERLAERISGAQPMAPVPDPAAWIEERFGVSLYSRQREIVEAIHSYRRVVVRAAHSVGKSKIAGLLAGYWIASHPVGSAFVFVTAPRTSQVRGIVFRELGRAHRDGHLPGRLNVAAQVPEWWMGDELVAVGRSPADRVDPEEAATAMQGIHAQHLLVIGDESAGLPGWTWDAIDSLASNAGARVLMIGNPTIRGSEFFRAAQPGSGWHSIRISAFDSPNLSGEEVPPSVARNLVSREWVEQRERRWGRSSPMYRSRVLAEFPDADDNALIEPRWIEEAQARDLSADDPPVLACDVARSANGDRTVIAENRAGRIRILHVATGEDTMVVTGHLARLLADTDGTAAVDEVGVGGGVLDRAREQGLPVDGFNAAARASDPARYRNARAEGFWMLREALKAGTVDLPDDEIGEELAAELLGLTWSVDSSGRILIGAKADLPHSPDLGDAVMMSIARSAEEVMPATFELSADFDERNPGPLTFDNRLDGLPWDLRGSW